MAKRVISHGAWLPHMDPPPDREVERMLDDPAWWVQVKHDGWRLLAYVTKALEVVGSNRYGEAHEVPDGLVPALRRVPEIGIDAEVEVGPSLTILDVLHVKGIGDLRGLPYAVRFEAAELLVKKLGDPRIRLVETAREAKAKRALMARVRHELGEGVIFKRSDALYLEGRSRTMFRVLNRHRADVVVMKRTHDGPDAHHSFEMYVYRGKNLVNVGSVSAQKYYDAFKPGQSAVAEVEYKYVTPDGRLFQPAIKRLRTDKRPAQCTVLQLKGTNRRFATKGKVLA